MTGHSDDSHARTCAWSRTGSDSGPRSSLLLQPCRFLLLLLLILLLAQLLLLAMLLLPLLFCCS
jgi:hypothetical protein